MKSELPDHCRNRWPEIFRGLGFGFGNKLLKHKNVPCPICGGTDRFQLCRKGKEDGHWYCRGCNKGGDGIALVMHALGLKGPDGFFEAARRIEEVLGIRSRGRDTPIIIFPTAPAPASDDVDTDKPLQPWREALPSLRSTAGERYLAARGLALTDTEAASLRFYRSLWHWPSRKGWPALVALVALADGTELCAHQTFLARDGSGKAPVEKPRLFPKGGRTAGGGVWFNEGDRGSGFVVAEGIESCLSAMRLLDLPSGCAALSAHGVRSLILPEAVRKIVIFADRDADGKGLRAAAEARRRWRAEGREVRISLPNQIGDANDILRRRLGL
jgi:putative DNA primase/helicase